MHEYSIHRSHRRCHATDREFAPGEAYYSAVLAKGSQLMRVDVAREAWKGPAEGTIGWWINRNPKKETSKRTPAPAHVLLATLDTLLDDPNQSQLAYLLALILIRRRVLVENPDSDPDDADGPDDSPDSRNAAPLLHLTHHATSRDFVIPVCEPSFEQSESLQQELLQVLFCES